MLGVEPEITSKLMDYPYSHNKGKFLTEDLLGQHTMLGRPLSYCRPAQYKVWNSALQVGAMLAVVSLDMGFPNIPIASIMFTDAYIYSQPIYPIANLTLCIILAGPASVTQSVGLAIGYWLTIRMQ